MMKSKFMLIFFLLFFQNSFCQSELKSQLELAFQLYGEEKYFDAITEFKRLQFFDTLEQYDFISNKFIALSYKHGGKFDLAVKHLLLAQKNITDIDSIFQIKIEILKVNLLRRNFFQVFNLLEELSNDARFINYKSEIDYWRGWTYIFNGKWDKASEEFSKLDTEHELKRLCENVHKMQYSKTTAKVLSYVLPGAGQFYSGNYFSGLLSLGWVTLWTYLSAQAFAADRIFDGVMIANFLAFRFYDGNLQNAEKFAEEYNNEINNWMLNYLQHNYIGEKP